MDRVTLADSCSLLHGHDGGSKTALVIVDLQKAFAPINTGVLVNITRLIKCAKHRGQPIILTQHSDADGKANAERCWPLRLLWTRSPKGVISYGSAGWELLDTVKAHLRCRFSAPTNSIRVVQKETHNAFASSNLDEILEGARVKRVVVCGMTTDESCQATAKAAVRLGYETFLVEDACSAAKEKLHWEALPGHVLCAHDIIKLVL